MRTTCVIFLCCLLLIESGCTTFTVTKVAPSNLASARGFRYSLPKPCLQITPNSDGTITVSVVYLPDLSNTYCIQSESYFSASTVAFSRQNGLLTQVSFSSNNAGGAASTIQGSTAIAGTVLHSTTQPSFPTITPATPATLNPPSLGGPAPTTNPSPVASPLSLNVVAGARLGPGLYALDEHGTETDSTLTLVPLCVHAEGQETNDAGQTVWRTYTAAQVPNEILYPQGPVVFAKDPGNHDRYTLTVGTSVPIVGAKFTDPIDADVGMKWTNNQIILVFKSNPVPGLHKICVEVSYVDSLGQQQIKGAAFTTTIPR